MSENVVKELAAWRQSVRSVSSVLRERPCHRNGRTISKTEDDADVFLSLDEVIQADNVRVLDVLRLGVARERAQG